MRFVIATLTLFFVLLSSSAFAAEAIQSQLPMPIDASKEIVHADSPLSSTVDCFDLAVSAMASFQTAGWAAGVINIQNRAQLSAEQGSNDLTFSVLREFHLKALSTRSFQRGQRQIILRIYGFETPDGAYGAYTFLRHGAETVVRQGDASSEDDRSLSFWQDNCFVFLSTSVQDDDEAKDVMRDLAHQVTQAMQKHASLPAVLAILPRLSRIAGSEKLIMGPTLGRHLLPIPYVQTLALEHCRIAAIADYQFQEPSPERLKLLLIDYGDLALPARVFAAYCQSLAFCQSRHASSLVPVFKVNKSYLCCQLKGNILIVIAGARKSRSLLLLISQLDYLLPENENRSAR